MFHSLPSSDEYKQKDGEGYWVGGYSPVLSHGLQPFKSWSDINTQISSFVFFSYAPQCNALKWFTEYFTRMSKIIHLWAHPLFIALPGNNFLLNFFWRLSKCKAKILETERRKRGMIEVNNVLEVEKRGESGDWECLKDPKPVGTGDSESSSLGPHLGGDTKSLLWLGSWGHLYPKYIWRTSAMPETSHHMSCSTSVISFFLLILVIFMDLGFSSATSASKDFFLSHHLGWQSNWWGTSANTLEVTGFISAFGSLEHLSSSETFNTLF